MTADLLHKWSKGRGALTYQQFTEIVLKMQPDALTNTQELAQARPATPELMNRVAKA